MRKLTTLLCCIVIAITAHGQQINLVKDIYGFGDDSNPYFLCTFSNGNTLMRLRSSQLAHYELYISDGTAAGTKLLSNSGCSDVNGVLVNDKFYYIGDDGVNGRELWVTDGTPANTMMLKDINPTGDGMKASGAIIIAYYNSRIYFAAGPDNDRELWSTDGTPGGTTRFMDINSNGSSTPRNLVVANGKLFFKAHTDAAGYELWMSDGTTGGTQMVKDLNPGADSGVSYNNSAIVIDHNKVYFVGSESATTGNELCVSDGTAAGTKMVKDLNPGSGSSTPYQMYIIGNKLFFSATTDTFYNELWVSDGTASGTKMVKDINPGANNSAPRILGNLNGKAIFVAIDGTHGHELWESDGTETGTKMIKDINPGSGHGADITHSINIQAARTLTIQNQLNGIVYFPANDGTNGRELWRTDGTAAGTYMVEDVAVHPDNGAGSSLSYIYIEGNNMWLSMTDGSNVGEEPYLYKIPPQNISSIAKELVTVVYPNPGNGSFNVNIQDYSFKFGVLQVADMAGRVVYDQNIVADTKNLSVTLPHVPPGTYIVNLILDNHTETHNINITK